MTPKPWREIAAAKKSEQLSRIPKEWHLTSEATPPPGTIDLRPFAASSGILSELELKITGPDYDATSLLAKIADGTYSAVAVVTAFCKRAAVAQQLCNCLTEIMFLDAIEAAKKLDESFEKTGKTVGALHGLPMTFKECFHIKGYDASDGYISRCFEPSTYDSFMVQTVREAGAVIIAKTNCPQTMLVAESDNNVFGQTKNLVVSHLTPGGSSGGEGSVVAFRGSALGIGTDVAGSIRVPSAANGIYGYKPSVGILPFYGFANSNWAGMNTAVIPFVFEQGVSDRRPVIGIITQSGLTPHPPIRRALISARTKLESAGYIVKDFIPPDFQEIRKITRELFTLDGLSYAREQLEKAGEPVVPSVHKIKFWETPAKSMEDAWAWNAKKGAIQKDMLDRWQAAGIDVVIAPAGPHTAVLPSDWTWDSYTVAWNAVDYPAVIIPFAKVDPEKDLKDEEFVAISEEDTPVQALFDPELLAGAPIALQIVGPRLGDEQLLKDVEMLDAVLNDGD